MTIDLVTKEAEDLQALVVRLERRVAFLLALVRLLVTLVRVRGTRLDGERLPEGEAKRRVLEAIGRAKEIVGLDTALRLLGLSRARYHGWRQAPRRCQLDDASSCPRKPPTQLTPMEVREIHAMVTDPAHRHIPLLGLARLAQRLGHVYASASTWAKVIRERGWTRPRERIHPASPREGVRVTRPNEYWHLDISVIRLLNGTRVNLQAVIDNFSRRILAWQVEPTREPRLTRQLLLEAAKWLVTGTPAPTVVADSGTENVNAEVDRLVESGVIRRVLAQVEVIYSNSMIEAWWRSLKHRWLYLNVLDTQAAVERLVAFYVEQHNTVIPHSALGGLTPDEVYFGRGEGVRERLSAAHAAARAARVAANREASCATCASLEELVPKAETPALPGVLQLRTPESRMSS